MTGEQEALNETEEEIAGWLDDLADHTDSSHDHDLIASLAESIRWGEHRGWNAKPPEAPETPPTFTLEDPPF
jgi:hypothetical protein